MITAFIACIHIESETLAKEAGVQLKTKDRSAEVRNHAPMEQLQKLEKCILHLW